MSSFRSSSGHRHRFVPRPGTLPVVVTALALLTTGADAAIVATLDAGIGSSTSTVQIDFSNGNGYLLHYHYDGAATGFEALLAFDALLPEFSLIYERTGFGPLVTGLGVLDDFEYGNGDQWPVVENYWHYWIADSGSWDFALSGASTRALFDGSFDGWVFGGPDSPQPVPAPPAGVILAAWFGRRRRRAIGR